MKYHINKRQSDISKQKMSYLDYLPEDIYTIIFAYIHPGEIINLCIVSNSKLIIPLNQLKIYFDSASATCENCKLRTYDYVKGWQSSRKLCKRCVKECLRCEGWMQTYPEDTNLRVYLIKHGMFESSDMAYKFIPGAKHTCKCEKYVCADCILRMGNHYKCKICGE